MHISVVPATLEHALDVANHLRFSDIQELIALTPETPQFILERSFKTSKMTWAGLVEDRAALVFGVGEATPNIGMVWMLGTPLVDKHYRSFLKQCRGCVDTMNQMYPLLTNAADARNTKTLAWLKWLGFELHPPIPAGRFQLPFVPFTRQLSCVSPQQSQ